jgi:hypothetical protein
MRFDTVRRTLGAQLAQFGSWHKPKFTGHWRDTGGIIAHVTQFACGRDHIVGWRPHGRSSELPEAYAGNIVGVDRR